MAWQVPLVQVSLLRQTRTSKSLPSTAHTCSVLPDVQRRELGSHTCGTGFGSGFVVP